MLPVLSLVPVFFAPTYICIAFFFVYGALPKVKDLPLPPVSEFPGADDVSDPLAFACAAPGLFFNPKVVLGFRVCARSKFSFVTRPMALPSSHKKSFAPLTSCFDLSC